VIEMRHLSHTIGALLVIVTASAARPAFAQIDLSGEQFVISTHFKREPDASKWMPTPCEPVTNAAR
jgi:hypothetical protein